MTITRRGFIATGLAVLVARKADATPLAQSAQRRGEFDPWLEIDAAALEHNVRTISRLAGGRKLFAVAKNNAYGCGLATAGPILERVDVVGGFAVVRPDEAFALRRAQVRKPIVLMGPASDEESRALVGSNVLLSASTPGDRERLVRLARRVGKPVRIHLYVDTGMHRMGLPHDRVLSWLDDAELRKAIVVDGAFTELTEDEEFDREQARRLRAIADAARAKGVSLGRLHAASSDAIARPNADTFLDMVRPGLAVYGGYVTADAMARGELRPAYRLKARVIRVDTLEPGDGVSYHRRYVASQRMLTATLALGHVDGYPSGAAKGCEVLIRGKLRPVIGTVSASHTIVSLGTDDTVRVGDEAIAVGPDDPALHPNTIAKRAEWSEYNMFMHLNPSLARVVVQKRDA